MLQVFLFLFSYWQKELRVTLKIALVLGKHWLLYARVLLYKECRKWPELLSLLLYLVLGLQGIHVRCFLIAVKYFL